MPTHQQVDRHELAIIIARSKRGQQKRSNNRQSSAVMLAQHGIEFESKNGGAHLILQGVNGLIDFWPGPGKWIVRSEQRERFGVKRLIEAIEAKSI
ncbi:hypothetical protein [Marinobacterium lutimaris]|uniref:Uncharacterized protein n=1 Tax=Marinobacterium lutimaris TaxID=568106 RepID=A0A1H5VTM4_9GAMM|nr:hypothetical protein [Marinobacterium lutimaris]SEF90191.1 hypothetical protein SAMN05444390_101826 [Marinobacterium lutimaris]